MHKYAVSTAKNGLGEQLNSECTPRGWHEIKNIFGKECLENSIFIGRNFSGEIYNAQLGLQKDFIMTRILQLSGIEPYVNHGGTVDTLRRFIYIHGTPHEAYIGHPVSHGCVRMRNKDIIALANWANIHMRILIN